MYYILTEMNINLSNIIFFVPSWKEFQDSEMKIVGNVGMEFTPYGSFKMFYVIQYQGLYISFIISI